MRILHTEWSDGFGGQEKRILAEAAGLMERGHYVAVVCREHARIKNEAKKLGIDVYTLPLRKPYDVTSMIKLAHFLRDKKFDIVNTHSGVDSWIGGIASRMARVPALARTRHLNIPLRRNLLNFIHYLPDVYITCGDNMRRTLVNRCGFPENKVVSIPTGVGQEFFDVRRNRGVKQKFGLDIHSPVITNVGILRSVKGHEVTLKAVRTVAEAFPDARFLLVGDGPDKRLLEKMADNLGISDHVVFMGFVEDVAEIYSFTDVAVLSSWSEGLPQSLLQAMAARVPVVSTKVGGVPEVIVHEKTGILVEPGDHEGLAQCIVKVLHDAGLAAQLVKNARETVKDYSSEKMIESIERLYKGLLKGKRG